MNQRSCFQWFKDTKMKANHNNTPTQHIVSHAVSNGSKILKWKQITTFLCCSFASPRCFQWFKDTKMKANHNVEIIFPLLLLAVSNGSKILKWKQITTSDWFGSRSACCFQWFKDTKMKANHNRIKSLSSRDTAVSNGSKILKWKQITTRGLHSRRTGSCFQWFKDTKMKANHN